MLHAVLLRELAGLAGANSGKMAAPGISRPEVVDMLLRYVPETDDAEPDDCCLIHAC